MRVIGTAGHIDHGKSSLVRALTGIDPDRLPEEKERGMTIELGFAWLDLGDRAADGAPDLVGVVDVPGHERFVRHMLAGVGGIDLALLVVAADEAVMPQTWEHLAILDLLDVRHGVVALTKCDLVDAEWLELASDEVLSALAGTSLAGSPIVPCSSVTGAGLDALRATLARALAATPERPDGGRPRLPIDRVFTRGGYGTVVTGTLLDGTLRVGQEVELVPGGRRTRIRGLQSHHAQVERAGPGRRIAANLAGVAVEEVQRGMVLCLPGAVPTAHYLDLRVRVVRPPAERHKAALASELTHNMAITLHTGTAEAAGRLRLLGTDRLGPGEEGWAQVRLDAPIGALRGDRCVIRVPSPAATVAGGTVVVVNPERHRRHDERVLSRLATLAAAPPEEVLLDAIAARPATAEELAPRTHMAREQVGAGLETLRQAGRALLLGESWATPAWLADVEQRAGQELARYHRRYPLRRGMSGEGLRDALAVDRRVWPALLARWRAAGMIEVEGEHLWLRGHTVRFDEAQERQIAAFMTALRRMPYAPPAPGELPAIDAEVLAAIAARGDVERLAEGVLIDRHAYEAMRDWALAAIDAGDPLTVAALRDHFATSRKIALALLEHLDDLRLTRRVGDVRVRGSGTTGRGRKALAEEGG